MAITLSTAARNAAANAVGALLNGGTLRLLSAGGVTLADLPFSATAFGAAVAGTITANPIVETAAAAAGTVASYEARGAGGVVVTGSVTAKDGGGDLELIGTTLAAGQPVRIDSFSYTAP